jgi:PAS domain S-box-containing protein
MSDRHADDEGDARFRLFVDAVKDYAILMLDPHGRVASWNVGAKALKGYATGEIVGESLRRLLPEGGP